MLVLGPSGTGHGKKGLPFNRAGSGVATSPESEAYVMGHDPQMPQASNYKLHMALTWRFLFLAFYIESRPHDP